MAAFLPALRNTLVRLYDEVKSIEVVSDDLGVANKRIPWQNAAVVVWHEVLKEFRKIKGSEEIGIYEPLLERVRSDYARDRELIDLENEVRGMPNELEQHLQRIGLDLDKIGPLDLVNCNRNKEATEFWKNKDTLFAKTGLCTVVMFGDQYDHPAALAERFVLEYINELKDDVHAVYIDRHPGETRIKTHVLDNRTEEGLRNNLQAYLEKMALNRDLSKFTALAHVFEVDVDASTDIGAGVLKESVEIFETFAREHAALNLLFLAVPTGDPQVVQSFREVADDLSGIGTSTTILDKLQVLGSDDIENWFAKNGADQVETIGAYLTQLFELEGLKSSKAQWEKEKKLAMKSMEIVQEQVFSFALKSETKTN